MLNRITMAATGLHDQREDGLRDMGWTEAADFILKGITCNKATYDFSRMVDGTAEVKCSAFGENDIAHMQVFKKITTGRAHIADPSYG